MLRPPLSQVKVSDSPGRRDGQDELDGLVDTTS